MKKVFEDLDIKISSFFMLVILIIAFLNVISRYFLHASLSFTEEFTTNLFVIIVLLGASYGVKEGSHFALDIVVNNLPLRGKQVCYFISDLLGLVLCSYISYYSVSMVIQQYNTGMITISTQVPQWIYSLSVPLGMFFMTYRFARRFISLVKVIIKGGES